MPESLVTSNLIRSVADAVRQTSAARARARSVIGFGRHLRDVRFLTSSTFSRYRRRRIAATRGDSRVSRRLSESRRISYHFRLAFLLFGLFELFGHSRGKLWMNNLRTLGTRLES